MTFANQAQEMHTATMASAYTIPLAKRQRLVALMDEATEKGWSYQQFQQEAKRLIDSHDTTSAAPPPGPDVHDCMPGMNACRQAQREEMAVCMVEGRTTPDNRRAFMGALEQYGPALSNIDWAVLLLHLLNQAFRGDASKNLTAPAKI